MHVYKITHREKTGQSDIIGTKRSINNWTQNDWDKINKRLSFIFGLEDFSFGDFKHESLHTVTPIR